MASTYPHSRAGSATAAAWQAATAAAATCCRSRALQDRSSPAAQELECGRALRAHTCALLTTCSQRAAVKGGHCRQAWIPTRSVPLPPAGCRRTPRPGRRSASSGASLSVAMSRVNDGGAYSCSRARAALLVPRVLRGVAAGDSGTRPLGRPPSLDRGSTALARVRQWHLDRVGLPHRHHRAIAPEYGALGARGSRGVPSGVNAARPEGTGSDGAGRLSVNTNGPDMDGRSGPPTLATSTAGTTGTRGSQSAAGACS